MGATLARGPRIAHFTISARHEGIPRILATLRRAIRLPGTLVREA
jgi:hypothetical protein